MRSIWAVARNTLAQAVRMKIAAVVVLLLLILLPLMSMVMDGDGTLLGKLRTFTSYGLGLIGMLLCILTIAVSTFTLSNDIKRKHIFLVITKPIRRWELVVGKLLAIVFLNIVLLGVFSGIVYGCTLLIPRISDASEMEKMRADAEFFTARVGVESFLDKEQLKEKAQKHYKELKDSGQIPEEMSYQRAIRELLGQEVMKAQKVDPGEVKEWDFENVRVKNPDDPNALIFVRCQFRVTVPPPDETVFGMWRIGDLRQLKIGGKVVTPIYNVERRAAVRTAQEFVIPADAIAEDGYLGLAFYNNPALN
ncbi:MAG: ABC transporter permease, partial [Planctomycetota bacterium]